MQTLIYILGNLAIFPAFLMIAGLIDLIEKLIKKAINQKRTKIMCNENYNGWTNRETWATMLHIDNDQGLLEQAFDYAQTTIEHHPSDDEGAGQMDQVSCLAESIENWISDMLNPQWWRDELDDEMTRGAELMRDDIGSLWRVNWREIATAILENHKENRNYIRSKVEA